MTEPIVMIKEVDQDHLEATGSPIESVEANTGKNFYLVKNIDPNKEIIDIAQLVATANIGPFNKEFEVLLYIPGHQTNIKEIYSPSTVWLKVEDDFALENRTVRIDPDEGASWPQAPRVIGSIKADVLIGCTKHDFILGAAGDDVLFGEDGEDFLLGGDGDDKIFGGAEMDEIYGGQGNDKLYGGAGDDRYIFGWDEGNNWGNDVVNDRGNEEDENLLIFQASKPEELQATRQGDNLLVTTTASSSSVNVLGFFNNPASYSFATGVRWSRCNFLDQKDGAYKFELASK